jgi:hypothetical protein
VGSDDVFFYQHRPQQAGASRLTTPRNLAFSASSAVDFAFGLLVWQSVRPDGLFSSEILETRKAAIEAFVDVLCW